MFRDKSLTPAETMRLAVLGALSDGDISYSDLANNVRGFVERIVGPSLDLLGSSLEVLRIEGLIEPVDGKGMQDNAVMRLSGEGRNAFLSLMQARLRAPMNDTQKLALALKLRYLDHLDQEDKIDQLDLLLDLTQSELARLQDLQNQEGQASTGSVFLQEWIALEIAQAESRRDWLSSLLDKLDG
ncbi:MAG: hypothetical protein RIM72_12910 [Alphaproteobacteria bacterium]